MPSKPPSPAPRRGSTPVPPPHRAAGSKSPGGKGGWSRPSLWIGLLLMAAAMALIFGPLANGGYEKIPTSQAVQIVMGDEALDEVQMTAGDQSIKIDTADDKKYRSTYLSDQTETLTKRLDQRVTDGSLQKWEGITASDGLMTFLLYFALPLLLLGGFTYFAFNAQSGGIGRQMSFGKSRAKEHDPDTPSTTFKDVAGCEEAIEELDEIREFLAQPAKFARVGAKIPKGVLLYGPPGTGKTLLARAVAGEAGVPFYSISGSDFVEMFVGVGASRVRDLFDKAKEHAPAIIFIDEIDAVGRHRGAGMGGGHDEREQTLNQLLVEMDGFDASTNVIMIAATNRPDVLDPALLRPGRFDRQIAVEAPDMAGRTAILKVHSVGKPLAADVNLEAVARRTPGFTGADLANVMNEAALLTARLDLPLIGNEQLDEAIDRVVAGPQKRTRLMSEHERLVTAYHEGGHALVAAAMPGTDPVQKITILPRGRALGYTMVMPDQDKFSQTRGELLDQMAYMMGGRAAEELVFHDPTTGASNDIEKATKIARAMVTQYGMSARLGTVKYGDSGSEPFVGMGRGGGSVDYSQDAASAIDQEVELLLEAAHQEAFDTLIANRGVLDELVRRLLVKETLGKEEIAELFAGLVMHPARGSFTGSDKRQPSQLPPVTPPPAPVAPEQPRPAGGVQLPPGQFPSPRPLAPSWDPPAPQSE